MAISLLVHLFIIILVSRTINKTNAETKHCIEQEKILLVELRKQLVFNSSHSTKLVKWNQSDDCCRWEGVECNGGHVIRLELSSESISGGLNDSSSSLSGLIYLEQLDLSYNVFSCPLPNSITNLQRLSNLDLSHCKIQWHHSFRAQ